ncbi:MAG: hypothetical protein NTY14_02335 [Candidatus Omnitrophica bacterium]|nr:hypothetical protein [Candidatus Omnitrophota bacterium]
MFNRKGQNILEYAILLALVVGAAAAMQTYVKRGLQGRVRNAVDHTGTGSDVGGQVLTFDGAQYEPYYVQSEADMTSSSTKQAVWANNGGLNNNGISEESRKKSGAVDTTLAPQ